VSPDEQGRLPLRCWTTYVLEADVEVSLPRGLRAEALPRGGDEPYRYRVDFGDYVGRLTVDGTELMVRSAKLDDEGFDDLLAQITSRIAELPFDFSTPTFTPFALEALAGRDLLYHAFLYLRWALWHAAPSLAEVWAAVSADPHRHLVREERSVEVWQARSVGAGMFERIVADPSVWCRVDPGASVGRTVLARALQVGDALHVPATVCESVVRSSLDTAENRFAKHVVRLMADVMEQAAALFGSGAVDPGLRHDAELLSRELRQMVTARWLDEVGELQRFPAESQVMQKRFGYREILGYYLALTLTARYPLAAADVTRLVETKSASTLYEYWTFFELADVLGRLVGSPMEATKTVHQGPFASTLAEGIRLDFPSVVGVPIELWYNRTFSRSRPGSPSYSVPLRPDVTLRIGDRLHLLDAKFRVDQFDVPESEAMTQDDAESQGAVTKGWFKHADIHKMHAYKDAIGDEAASVETVWVLYPGTEFAFFDESGVKAVTPKTLAPRPRGVGAIPMVPLERSSAVLGEVLMRVLE